MHFVLGMVSDKSITDILKLLPHRATYYFTKANIPRAMHEQELQLKAKKFRLKGKCYPTVSQACKAANRAAKVKDLVFIGGSTFVVAEAV